MIDNKENNQTENSHDDDTCEQSRRDAIKKMGKYAAYTAPAMLTLLASKKSIADCISCG
jgi:hypothetical protein